MRDTVFQWCFYVVYLVYMKIHVATDHAGFAHKEAIKQFIREQDQDIEVIDHGAFELVATDDYPDFIIPCAEAVAEDTQSVGIIFGGSGQGEAMAANRVEGIRAVAYYGGPIEILTLSRAHNNANILSIGARFVTIEETIEAIKVWSEIPFSNDERDIRRIDKLN